MAVYERRTRVAAPFEDVWEFHSQISGLDALTPGWMNLEIESVTGPDGEADPEILEAGARAESSVRPFGVGPRQQWTSVITERESGDGTAMFRDTMEGGPFAEWEHTHSFYADGDGTVVHDHVEYQLPFGPLGRMLGPLAVVGLEPMFRFRHRKTKELLE
ncbi:SRPBCC family protein [Halorientalis litorea]|jgi:ligand-binding SRPBCC domain-containing protein|uniref:SRPBCC family protein n=1 Tax=Halorientalis litorea TaxID=2931977 RepID=UPI001FF299EF|nr:SRPBCC family protein [Halorientalis litorea]